MLHIVLYATTLIKPFADKYLQKIKIVFGIRYKKHYFKVTTNMQCIIDIYKYRENYFITETHDDMLRKKKKW